MAFNADAETEKRIEETILRHGLKHPSKNDELRSEALHSIKVATKYVDQLLHAPDMDPDVRVALLLQTKEVLFGLQDFILVEWDNGNLSA